MSFFITITGIVFFVYGMCLCILSNLNLGVILTLLIGVFFLGCGIFYREIKKHFRNKLFRCFGISVIILLCAELALVAFIGIYGNVDNVSYDEDAVIVLGAGIRGDRVTLPLKQRLDKAVEYHKINPDALIVVTGGQGFQETVTEAYAMEKYLIDNGVNPGVILKEEKATSTNENMMFSKEILDSYFSGSYKTVVITNNFHIYRSAYIARLEGFEEVFHIHAGLQWYNIIPCYLRESLAVLKMWVLG